MPPGCPEPLPIGASQFRWVHAVHSLPLAANRRQNVQLSLLIGRTSKAPEPSLASPSSYVSVRRSGGRAGRLCRPRPGASKFSSSTNRARDPVATCSFRSRTWRGYTESQERCHPKEVANFHHKLSGGAQRRNTEAHFGTGHRKAFSSPHKAGNAPHAVHQFPRAHEIPFRVSGAVR